MYSTGSLTLLAFFLGVCVGSFLNVVVYRVPRGESIAWPGSRCPRCTTPLAALDNIPLISFLFLAARCRHCGAPISVRYPVIEGVGGLLAVSAYLMWGFTLSAIFWGVFLAALVAVALIDLDTFVIPDSLCMIIALCGLVLARVSPAEGSLTTRLLTCGLSALSVWAVGVLSRGGMGLGDAKLLGAMGLALGPRGVIVAFGSAVLLGAVAGVVLLGLRRKQRGDPIPFGPFLALGAVVAALGGSQIIGWYARSFLVGLT